MTLGGEKEQGIEGRKVRRERVTIIEVNTRRRKRRKKIRIRT